jgi:hypothetical protein
MARMPLVAFALASLVAGCRLGPEVNTYPPANTLAGMELTVRLNGGSVTGELLSVRDTELVLVIHQPDPDSSGLPRLARVLAPSHWSRTESERHRLLSRYPQGISPQLEARLLAAYEAERIPWLR